MKKLIFILAILLADKAISQCSGTRYLLTGYPGLDGISGPLPNGTLDLNWRIVAAPGGISVPFVPKAFTVPNYYTSGLINAQLPGGIVPTANLRILGPGATATSNVSMGWYTYQTRFCLDANTESVSLHMKYLADNKANVYLNGTLVAQHFATNGNTGFQVLKDVTVTDINLFNLGVGNENILDVRVYNNPYTGAQNGKAPTISGLLFYAKIFAEGPTKGDITIHKWIDANFDNKLDAADEPGAGVTFNVYNSANQIVSTGTTDANGNLVLQDILYGTYTIREVLPAGFAPVTPATGEMQITISQPNQEVTFLNKSVDCCNSFKPIPGGRYWVSAWVKEEHAAQVTSYLNSFVQVEFFGAGAGTVQFGTSGEIIDGWQRIVGDFTIPMGTTNIGLHLVNNNSSIAAFFDDVRVHPFNASMKSYVYDPVTLWLTAELDDNNYATFYEYDNEGQLIRIKKETERGIMTIQESRSSNPKKGL